jgi:dihydroorotase
MQKYLIKNISIVNEGTIICSDVLFCDGKIEKIANNIAIKENVTIIDGENKYLFPGVIDDQVHFREPGLTHKATIHTESVAAVAGGTTSFMEMPNTIPPVFTQELLQNKYDIASQSSVANYSFYMGTSNENAEEVLKTNKLKNDICGIKIFMGSSTGGLLVDNYVTLHKIFAESELLIATHCEDEKVIAKNLAYLKSQNVTLTAAHHPIVRDEEACFESSYAAIQLAQKHNTRLHVLHISTEKEIQLFGNMLPLAEKRITAEVCVHHLHFTSDDYETLGYQIKCNPAIKSPNNKYAIWNALLDGKLDVIATDHAPHTMQEKTPTINSINEKQLDAEYSSCHAGLPLVQHSLLLMLHYYKLGIITLEQIAEKMSHNVAVCFQIKNRGFIREGYCADAVIVDLNEGYKVTKNNILYKCNWSPLEGFNFPAKITHTFVNGNLVYGNGVVDESIQGERLQFNRN